jgi:DNA-binding MarR family transcriptional regulator
MKINQTPEDYSFALQQATRDLSRLCGWRLPSADITRSQFCVLWMVRRVPNLSISDLAKAMLMDRATLVGALRPLKRRNYLLVNLDHLDRHRYELTSAGAKKLEETEKLQLDAQLRDQTDLEQPPESSDTLNSVNIDTLPSA